MQVAIWKLSHIKDQDVPKPSEENGWTKNHDKVLEPSWAIGDILPTNLADILEHQNVDETEDDELDLNDDTGITMTKKLTVMSIKMTNSMAELYFSGSKF